MLAQPEASFSDELTHWLQVEDEVRQHRQQQRTFGGEAADDVRNGDVEFVMLLRLHVDDVNACEVVVEKSVGLFCDVRAAA